MGRIKNIDSARKVYECSKCKKKIEIGSPYIRGEMFRRRPLIRCVSCGIKSWEVETSEFARSVGEIAEEWNNLHGCDDGTPEAIAQSLEEIKDQCEESLENMPDNLRENSETGELLQNRIDCLEAAIDALNEIDTGSISSTAQEEAENEYEDEGFETEAEKSEAIEETAQELFEQYLSEEIEDALSNIEY